MNIFRLKQNISEYEPKTKLEQIVLSNLGSDWDLVRLLKNPNITRGFIKHFVNSKDQFPYVVLSPNICLNDYNYTQSEIISMCYGSSLYLWLTSDMTKNLLDKLNRDQYDTFVEKLLNHLNNKNKENIIGRWSAHISRNIVDTVIHIISLHQKTHLSLIKKFIHYLDFPSISKNPNLTSEFINEYQDKLDWYYISINKCLNLCIIKKFHQLNKYLYSLTNNANFNNEWAEYVLKKTIGNEQWIYNNIRYQVSKHPNVTIEFIDKNKHLPWCWVGISENPNLTMKFLIKNKKLKFSPSKISKNPSISMEDYWQNERLSFFWDHSYLVLNPNIDEASIVKLGDKVNYQMVSLNKSLDIDIVIKLNKKSWDYRAILENIPITIKQFKSLLSRINSLQNRWFIVSKNIIGDLGELLEGDLSYLPWNWDGLCINPNIEPYLVEKFKNKLDSNKYNLLSGNLFSHDKNYDGHLEYNDKAQKLANKILSIIKEELMIRTWRPNRFEKWCLDIEDQKELNLI